MKLFLKILLWIVLVVALLGYGVLVSTVKVLKPERLTAIVEDAANRALNADVSVARVAIELRHTYPFLNLQVDSLVVVSRDIAMLPPFERDSLPAWGDTLAAVERFKGGINLAQLAKGRIYLNDVEIVGPSINLLVVNEQLNNFSIAKPSPEEEKPDSAFTIPDVRVKSFAIKNPGLLRYLDAATGMQVEGRLSVAEISSQEAEPGMLPKYAIDIYANVGSPLLAFIGQRQVLVGCDGIVDWKYVRPYELTLTDFTVAVDSISAKFSTAVDFTDEMLVKDFDGELAPVGISYLLGLVPPQKAKELNLPQGLRTDAHIGIAARLNKPYTVGSDLVPHATVRVSIPDSWLLWRKVDLRKLALDVTAEINGNDLNASEVQIDKLLIAGPATTIDIAGRVTDLVSDPLFDGRINGRVALEHFPPQVTALLGGFQAKGKVKMNAKVKGRPSMLSRNDFHKLRVDGTIDVDDFYYLAPDTLTMICANHAHGEFGTNSQATRSHKRRGSDSIVTRQIDSLLTAKITVDSSMIMTGGLDMRLSRFSLGVGAKNTGLSDDTTLVIPMGGRLQVGIFSLFTLSDSAGFRIRNLDGNVAMQRYRGDAHLPLFTLDAKLGRLSAGDNKARFMVTNAQLRTRINKLAETPAARMRKEVKHLADSLAVAYPDIPADSVFALALEIRRKRSPAHHSRVRLVDDSQDNELVDWGTSSGLRRLLLDWNLRGTLKADRARLFTPAFPLRNRVADMDLRFNNDSIILNNLTYKAGHSDFSIRGAITNIKRSLTARRTVQSLKMAFDMVSDTIDVNQLAHAFFTGAANSQTELTGDFDDERALDAEVQSEKQDSVGPLLVPINIDAEFKMKANNVLYSDFLLKDLRGTLLLYDGAISLNNLRLGSDVGSINLSALYSAPKVDDMKFGFGMKLDRFNIGQFLKLVPAIDSIMPMIRDFDGIINANLAATSRVDRNMNLVLPTLDAAIKLSGDSLVLLDPETYALAAKWLMFKNKHNNMINHMAVEMIVENNMMQIFPFIFDFDRYRLGVQGHNDLEMNFDYHIAVLKSPLPFKFGINIKGNSDDYKIRLGKARFNEQMSVEQVALADTMRVNLINQFENVFRRGVQQSGMPQLNINRRPEAMNIDLSADTLTRADSLMLQREGLVP